MYVSSDKYHPLCIVKGLFSNGSGAEVDWVRWKIVVRKKKEEKIISFEVVNFRILENGNKDKWNCVYGI